MVDKQKLELIFKRELELLGYELVEFKLSYISKRYVLGIYVDFLDAEGPVSKVTVQDCSKLSKNITAFIDKSGFLGVDNYYLEVSSPGLNRKLNTLKDFERFVGSPVRFTLNKKGKKLTVKGKIDGVDGETVIISTGTGKERFVFTEIKNARLRY